MEEAETPLPREETTPPVTKTYFVRWLAVAAVIPCFFVITPRAGAEYDALWGRKLRVSNYGKKGAKKWRLVNEGDELQELITQLSAERHFFEIEVHSHSSGRNIRAKNLQELRTLKLDRESLLRVLNCRGTIR